MIAEDRGRASVRTMAGLALAGALGLTTVALAQQNPRQTNPARPGQTKAAPASKAAAPNAKPVVEMKVVPVKPTDAVAVINNEVVTRQQLADECVARKGEEVLETLIARKLIEQAMRAHKMEVTAGEITEEINRIAQSMAGVTGEQWLRTLAKERNISPAQYARDIIYPALALRKLAEPRVQVTDQDVKDAFEAQYGEKLSYRLIMTSTQAHAMQIWEELKKNPAGFEHVARNDPRSIDQSTRAEGGKPITGPLQRHSYPREVTDLVFRRLVDGDPDDTDPNHKPKDGDITGPIQVTETSWILVKREGLIPAVPYDAKNDQLKEQMRQAVLESKVQQHMEQVYAEMFRSASIENKLTGNVKQKGKEVDVAAQSVDGQVQRMSQPAGGGAQPAPTQAPKVPAASVPAPGELEVPPPSGVSSEELEAVKRAKVNAPAETSSPK